MSSFNWRRTFTVARTDVKQLVLAKDFWMPMGILGSIFFVFVPLFLLLSITSLGDVPAVQNVANTLEVLPQAAQDQIQGDTPQGVQDRQNHGKTQGNRGQILRYGKPAARRRGGGKAWIRFVVPVQDSGSQTAGEAPGKAGGQVGAQTRGGRDDCRRQTRRCRSDDEEAGPD